MRIKICVEKLELLYRVDAITRDFMGSDAKLRVHMPNLEALAPCRKIDCAKHLLSPSLSCWVLLLLLLLLLKSTGDYKTRGICFVRSGSAFLPAPRSTYIILVR